MVCLDTHSLQNLLMILTFYSSNITTVKLSQFYTNIKLLQQNMTFLLTMHYIIHTLVMINEGGVLSSTGFTISGDTNEMFLNDDGNGNVRLYYITRWNNPNI